MSIWCCFRQLKRPCLQFSKHSKFYKSLHIQNRPLMRNFCLWHLPSSKTKQPIVRFLELSGFIQFLALFMQCSTKCTFKTSSFQCSFLLLNIDLGFIITIIILCIDDGIDQKNFCNKCFLNIYFRLISYFMATLSINKREAICFLIETMYLIVFI